MTTLLIVLILVTYLVAVFYISLLMDKKTNEINEDLEKLTALTQRLSIRLAKLEKNDAINQLRAVVQK